MQALRGRAQAHRGDAHAACARVGGAVPLQLHLLVQLQAQVACAAARMRQTSAGSVSVWLAALLALPKALMLLESVAAGLAAGAGHDCAAVPLGKNSASTCLMQYA